MAEIRKADLLLVVLCAAAGNNNNASGPLQVSDSFPFKWINKKWKEGFYVTSMATSHTRWAVVMSRNAGFVDQVRAAAAA